MYQQTVNEIRRISEAINPDGLFVHGTEIDASGEFEGPFPVLHLFPFEEVSDPEEFTPTEELLLGIWLEDRPDSTTEEREALIAAAHGLTTQFLNVFKESLILTGRGKIRREPQYQTLSAYLSGYAIKLTAETFEGCEESSLIYGFIPYESVSQAEFDSLTEEQKESSILYLIETDPEEEPTKGLIKKGFLPFRAVTEEEFAALSSREKSAEIMYLIN